MPLSHIMVWDEKKDDILCRENLLFEPYQFKPQTRERGNAWKTISENLMASKTINFKVDTRAVRERLLNVVIPWHKVKTKEQLAASGISPENNSLDDAVEEIIEKMEEAEKTYEQENVIDGEKKDQEVANAQEMRKWALESFTETKKRNKDSEESQKEKKKTRSSGWKTIICLREKVTKDQQFKTDEHEIRKRELEIRKAEFETTQNQQNQMFQYLQA